CNIPWCTEKPESHGVCHENLRIQSENEKTVYLYSSKDTVGVCRIDDPANDLNRKMKKFRNFYDRLKASMITARPPLILYLKEWAFPAGFL
ncbi:MAG: hypothetical protein VZT48_12175, partial [Bulleidia sp.]|nr:hypothetical protein [Bulleidia sp.]